MNVLHIITHYDPVIYGAENFAKHVAEYQAQGDNNVWVITGKWQETWQNEEQINGVTVIRVKVFKIRYIQTLLAAIPLYKAAVRVVRQQKIDWVHAHIYPGMIVGYLVKLRTKVPFVSTIQGGDIGDYNEVFGPFKGIAKRIIGYCLRKANKVHCVSTYLADEVSKMGVSKEKIVVVPNGVDIKKFQFSITNFQNTTNQKTIKIISTSRLELKNNLEYLIDVVSRLKQKGFNIVLHIYGKGSLQKKTGAQNCIIWLGRESCIKGVY